MDIGHYLNEHGVTFTKHEHRPAFTAQEVAAEEHISGNMLAKPVLVRVDDHYALCVLPASCKLDMAKVAVAADAREVRLADEGELAKVFPDVEVGAEPPFGSLYDIETMVDQRLADMEEIAFQAGTHHTTIRMAWRDYASLVQPRTADLSLHM